MLSYRSHGWAAAEQQMSQVEVQMSHIELQVPLVGLHAIVISWATDVAEWSTGVQFKLHQLKVNLQYVKRWASDVTGRATFTWHTRINRCCKTEQLLSTFNLQKSYICTLSCRSNLEMCQFYPFSATTGFKCWCSAFSVTWWGYILQSYL